jgi:hypothetical protein
MVTLIEKYGRLALVEDGGGYCWELTSRVGTHWYWKPLTGQWTLVASWSRTPQEAGAGLGATLAHPEARSRGSPDQRRRADPTRR